MEFRFRTKALGRQYAESRRAVRAYGEQVARRFVARVNIIRASRSLDELFAQRALACHPLLGDRKGQYAMKLTGRYRLIFTVERGNVTVVCIEEVSKHYDD